MRPAGDVRRALMFVACAAHRPEQSPTLGELAGLAGVGKDVARWTVQHMNRAGALRIERTRRVAYRNRPVAEYAPAVAAPGVGGPGALQTLLQAWAVPA